MKFIQIVLTKMKYQAMQKSLYTVEILIPTLTVFKIGFQYWVIVLTANIAIPEGDSENTSLKKTIVFHIFEYITWF